MRDKEFFLNGLLNEILKNGKIKLKTEDLEETTKKIAMEIVETWQVKEDVLRAVEKGLVKVMVKKYSNLLVPPAAKEENIEILETTQKEESQEILTYTKCKNLKPFLSEGKDKRLLFRELKEEENFFGLEDFTFYLIEWRNKKYLGLYDENSERFAVDEETIATYNINEMFPENEVDILGVLVNED